ncbi:MAG: alpha-glucosidase [Lachnospiraceae bacterium]|nr:alpha-glucosidase [Lachnospiraceae bacterium]
MKKQWWHNKVAYQIYPKSFYDSNGDGIGDLPGIISKLDYLKDLGIDILWLSPIYVSPLADQGYDIADYYNIDPRFGTMEDMDRLLAEAKKRDMYVLMDLVVNHCSDEHEWFRKACEDPDGRYGKFFYIETVKTGEKLPCNWRSYFGGPVWDRLPGHEDKYYLHVFHKKQPDLNWENPELRKEVYRMINWWLDKGLAGFRIDAIINIKKVLPFKDYTVDREDGLASVHQMLHEQKGVGEFLGEMRDQTFAPHSAFTVGEVFNEKPEEIPDFIGENGYFSSMFDFAATVFGQSQLGWYLNRDITPDDYRDCVFATQKKVGETGFISNIIENHDEPRGVSHYIPSEDLNNATKKLLATEYFLLRGLPWIYQGQEIGMENIKVNSIDEIDDISSIDAYQVALDGGAAVEDALEAVAKYSRDNARTPFQWSAAAQAGFTTGTPWLRLNPNFKGINLETEMADPDSIYHYYKKLIALRKDPAYADALVYGSFVPYLQHCSGIMSYLRCGGGQNILVMGNFNSAPQTLPLPEGMKISKILLGNLSDSCVRAGDTGEITLQKYEAIVSEVG